MLRQIHIFLESELLFVKDYARALGTEELTNVKKIIQKYIDMPMPGKTFQRAVSNFQIFHRASGNLYFLFITDLVDSLQYIESIIIKIIEKVKELFPNPKDINGSSPANNEFNELLDQIQRELHSKITIIGPVNSGKTTLYKLLKNGEEKTIMDFARTSTFEIDGLYFDIWDFQIRDNFSPLWSKFVSGSDLIIVLFNLANYNLKIFNYFLDIQKLNSNYSKLLIVGNKRDLVEEHDIKRIKNELNLSDFKELSLNSFDAKSQVLQSIREALDLKKNLPSNFESLVKEADNLVLEGKKVQALAKYKELIFISESYQNIIYTKNLEKKIQDISKKIQKESEKRKEIDKEKDFEMAKPLLFKRRITVKPLPSLESSDQPQEQAEVMEELTPVPQKPAQKLVSFQKLEKEIEIKPPKIPKPPLKIIKTISAPKDESKKVEPTKTIEQKPKAKMPMELFGTHKDLKKDIDKSMVIDYTKVLQRIITQKGSSLSLKLCHNLITELESSLGRPLTIEDVELAAEFFVKQEKLT